MGVPAPASLSSPDAATNDAPPIPTIDDFTRRDPVSSHNLRNLGDLDPARRVEDTALSWGRNQLNSSAEALVSTLTDNAHARINFDFDRHGRIEGEADVLLPLYDTPRALFFTQLGIRNMTVNIPNGEANDKDRWIGNFGLGHRSFPNANVEDSGNWMFGANMFLDHDFTRAHNRGGIGVELQYERVRVSSNLYVPLSGWKDSRDFDQRFMKENPGRFMEERPAKGWDIHVEAPLPFYPNLAFTGGLTRWYGDKVDTLGHGALKKDPKIWEFGVKYTPIPLFTASVTQRNTEGGRQDTVVGLSFTYRFDMSWSQQTNPAKVRDTTSVGGVRYDPVERENRMPLARRERNHRERIDPPCAIVTGGTVTYVAGKTPGTYDEVHTFEADDALVFNGTRPATVEVLVVAGGGGGGMSGGTSWSAGGGGAGRYIHVQSYPIAADSITVKVGAGGAGATSVGYVWNATRGGQGGDSVFGGITANGGGGGAGHADSIANGGLSGGSGGGASGGSSRGSAIPGTVDSGSGVENWGSDGGGSGYDYAGGSGGGAKGAGTVGTGIVAGGAGAESAISGQEITYARGGNASNTTGVDGAPGSGNGGSGGTGGGGQGGSGIVIVRFPYPSSCSLPSL